MLTLLSAFLLIVYVGFMLTFPFRPVEFGRFEVTEYVVSENIPVLVEFNKKMNIKPIVEWYLVDGVVYRLNPENTGVQRDIGDQEATRFFKVPDALPDGIYRLQVDIRYPVFGNLRYIDYTLQSNEFVIQR